MTVPSGQKVSEEQLGETVVSGGNAAGGLDATYVAPQQPQGKRMEKPAAKSTEGKPAEDAGKSDSKGQKTLGKYKLVRKLGQGGMGEVYLGEDTKLGRQAAIKVMAKALASKEDFVARFYREARAMAKMNHDNAVSVYDVDEENGFHYVAMEFVDGKSMQAWMDKLGKLPVGDALHVVLRCAEALQVAHNQSMVHRDIKPDNIMLTSKGKVKVADFGLAKATDEDMSMTQSGTGLGTPYYMAPEQARNAKHVDGRTDIYALGITLYYFLTGKLPFTGNSALEVVMNKEKGQFTPARRINSEVPERLDLMIDKMIAKDLNMRFKDCAEVIKHLAGLGLESPSLSFIDAPDKVVQTASGGASSGMGASRGPQSMVNTPRPQAATTGTVRSSADDARRSAAPASNDPAQQWIVQYKNSQGKDTIQKLTTAQIQTALRTGSIDTKAKLKKNANDQFMPVGYYPEFESSVQAALTKQKADEKSSGHKALYAQIEKQYMRRGWTRWFQNLISGTKGLISLIIWLAVVFGGIGALVVFRAQIWDAVAGKVNSVTTPTPAPGGTPEQPK